MGGSWVRGSPYPSERRDCCYFRPVSASLPKLCWRFLQFPLGLPLELPQSFVLRYADWRKLAD